MGIGSRRVLWSLTASLTVMGSLPSCSGADRTGSASPASFTATTSTAAPASASTVPPVAETPGPATAGSRTERWVDLAVGDCLADLPPLDPGMVTVAVVDCAAPHRAEVYLRVPAAVDTAIADVANDKCAAGFSQYTGEALGATAFAVSYLIDSNQDRTSSNPDPSTIICLLQDPGGRLLTGTAGS